jgi:hypothetical protein
VPLDVLFCATEWTSLSPRPELTGVLGRCGRSGRQVAPAGKRRTVGPLLRNEVAHWISVRVRHTQFGSVSKMPSECQDGDGGLWQISSSTPTGTLSAKPTPEGHEGPLLLADEGSG